MKLGSTSDNEKGAVMKKKIPSKTLILARETIRALSLTREQLQLVNGGVYNDTTESYAEDGGCTDNCVSATCKPPGK